MEKTIKIGICDDQPIIAGALERIVCNRIKQKNINAQVRCYYDGSSVLGDAEQLDILFLDIEMPDMDGIEVGKAIRRAGSLCKIIMATGQDDRFKDAFLIQAFRFLTKPFQAGDVEQAFDDAVDSLAGYESIDMYIERVPYPVVQRRIAYLRAYDSHVVAEVDGVFLRRKESLTKMQELLDNRIFYRISRDYLVNFYHISEYKAGVIKIGEFEIKVPRRIKKEFERAYWSFCRCFA